MASLSFGCSDFVAGLASRRFAPEAVVGVVQALGLVFAAGAVLLFPGHGLDSKALAWGAVSGVGGVLGLLSLYRGLAVGRMGVVVPLSAVLVAVIPALVGVAVGNRLSGGAWAGIAIALPALTLVSWQPRSRDRGAARAGVVYAVLAGVGFSLFFIALDRAGRHSGAWPLLVGQVLAALIAAPFALRALRGAGPPTRAAGALALGAGCLAGAGNLFFLAAVGRGQLATVAVITSLYPAVPVLLARAFLGERWSRAQGVGLAAAGAAVVLISAG